MPQRRCLLLRQGLRTAGLASIVLVLAPETGSAQGFPHRNEDSVIVRGRDLPGMLRDPVRTIGVFRSTGSSGAMEPVPFQVDEFFLDEKLHRYVPILESAPNNPAPDQALDEADEVVFMAMDLGERHPEPEALGDAVYEVKVVDPARDTTRWAYIVDRTGFPPARGGGMKRLVGYDARRDEVDTSFYRVRFHRNQAAFPRNASVRAPGAESWVPFLDGSSVKVILDIKFLFDLHLTEDNFRSELIGYKAGPIRVIRRVESEIRFVGLRFRADAATDFLFYRGSIEFPTRFHNPLSPWILREDSRAYSSIVLDSKSVSGAHVLTTLMGPSCTVNGKTTADERAAEGRPSRWWSILGKDWGVFSFLSWGPTENGLHAKARFHYRDWDEGEEHHPEVGYCFNILEFPQGSNEFTVRQYVGPYVRQEDLPELLVNRSMPLETSIHLAGRDDLNRASSNEPARRRSRPRPGGLPGDPGSGSARSGGKAPRGGAGHGVRGRTP